MCVLSRAERAAFSAVLGLLWAWLVIQDVGLANRWDAPAVILDVVILAASVVVCYGGLTLWEGLAAGKSRRSS